VYQEYYGFDRQPFGNTPNAQNMFLTRQHREALNHLLYGIVHRKGFILLTGEIGAGKSTVCRAALERLGNSFETAWIVNPSVQKASLLRAIAIEFNMQVDRDEPLEIMHRLNGYLVDRYLEDKVPILIIDEAQNLSVESLEQVRLLSNLETGQEKLLQIVLIGQPELREKINHPSLIQLKQRIAVRYHIDRLSRKELADYIQHQIDRAHPKVSPHFTKTALWRIHQFSKGIPRLINSVCDQSLLAGYVYRNPHIDLGMVGRAIREISGKI
jgi:general secretion pathway protein A